MATKIAGAAHATAAQMIAYIQLKNKQVPQSVIDMIPLYISEGEAEGIRGDIAFAQSCLETGNFVFKPSDTAVTLAQNNFCGMGVTSYGKKGNSFSTPQQGIRAQIQHLKAYANNEPLVNPCVDPRFKYVTRGSSKYVEWLGIKENPSGVGWAGGANYGSKILTILSNILNIKDAPVTIYDGLYRVRPSWDNLKAQKEAFQELENAKRCCDSNAGCFVFSDHGICVYPLPYMVTITESFSYYTSSNGNTKAGSAAKGKYTIVEVDAGTGCGRLKSGAGWIRLGGLAISRAEVSLREKAVQFGTKLYDDIVKAGCEHKGGVDDAAEIIAKRRTTCAATVTAILVELGILKKGKHISHTAAVGGSTANILKKKDTIQKVMSGYGNLDLTKCDVHLTLARNWDALPDKYKVPGFIYVQDSNNFFYPGKDKQGRTVHRSCNNHSGKQVRKDAKGVYRYYNNTMYSGYTFTSPILAVIGIKG